MSDQINYELESVANIKKMGRDACLETLSRKWINTTCDYKYVYNWQWLGRPIIQFPTDIVATQEVIWSVQPTIIIETGVAHGGSVIFNASQLALLDLCKNGFTNIRNIDRRCIGIDIGIREDNRKEIERHALFPMIELIEGSSVDLGIYSKVKDFIRPNDIVMVILDSNHTHDHVLRELELYAPLVSKDSFIIVHDTGIEYASEKFLMGRPWGAANNPLSAIRAFLVKNQIFDIDEKTNEKLLITSSKGGYLKRTK